MRIAFDVNTHAFILCDCGTVTFTAFTSAVCAKCLRLRTEFPMSDGIDIDICKRDDNPENGTA